MIPGVSCQDIAVINHVTSRRLVNSDIPIEDDFSAKFESLRYAMRHDDIAPFARERDFLVIIINRYDINSIEINLHLYDYRLRTRIL